MLKLLPSLTLPWPYTHCILSCCSLQLILFPSIDINECSEQLHQCHTNAECLNTDGSYLCQCMQGYQGNGYQCIGKPTTLVPCNCGVSPLHSDQRRRYMQSTVGSLVVSSRLCKRGICYDEHLKKNRLDATINVGIPHDVVSHT